MEKIIEIGNETSEFLDTLNMTNKAHHAVHTLECLSTFL